MCSYFDELASPISLIFSVDSGDEVNNYQAVNESSGVEYPLERWPFPFSRSTSSLTRDAISRPWNRGEALLVDLPLFDAHWQGDFKTADDALAAL